MKRKNDHLKLVNKNSERPLWKKALRFLFRLTFIVVILLLLKQGETFFRINKIEVQGAGELTAAEIISAGEVRKGSSIILLQEDKIAEKIQNVHPWVKNVEITRILPDRIIIAIEVRRSVGSIRTENGFWMIDSNTIPFAYMTEPAADYPVIAGIKEELIIQGVPLDCRERREALSNFFAVWCNEKRFEIAKIDMTDSYNLVVVTGEEMEIWFGDGKNMQHKLDLVEKSLPYITVDSETRLDVRSGNRLVLSSTAGTVQKEVGP